MLRDSFGCLEARSLQQYEVLMMNRIRKINHNNISKRISVLKAFNIIKNNKQSKLNRRDVLLDCKREPSPRGITKQWEIRLRFFHVLFAFAGFMLGKPLSGTFTCHKTGDFVTYCISIQGQDYWFDQYELALDALSNDALFVEFDTFAKFGM